VKVKEIYKCFFLEKILLASSGYLIQLICC